MSVIESEQQPTEQDIKDSIEPENASWTFDIAEAMFLSLIFGTDNQTEFGLPFVGQSENEVRTCAIEARAPTADDDIDDGYKQYSLFLDTTTNTLHMCIDPTAGSAIWRQITNKPNTVSYTLTNTDESTTVTHNLSYIPNVVVLDSNGKDITSGVDINHDLGTKNSFTVSAEINESNIDSIEVKIKYYP